MLYSAVVNQFLGFMLILLSRSNLYAYHDDLCCFLSDHVFIATSTFPYLFSFDEPRSISDLDLNYDIRAIEYGGNIGILPSWIYVFGRIEGIT